MKLYDCQVPSCRNKAAIRSKIKTGEFAGSLACTYCKSKFDGGIKKQTAKNKKKRKEERSGLPEFFEKAIEDLCERPICENCGSRINAGFFPASNIAHILSKRRYKSVMDHPDNYVLLCSGKDDANGCHEKFDNDIEGRVNMPVFTIAKKKFEKFSPFCLEKGAERTIFEEN